jgi:hypothetical protein
MKKRLVNYSISTSILFVVILTLSSCSTDTLQKTTVSPFYDSIEHKLWKHRVNCISTADSIARNFPGIEIDIYYVDSLNAFMATHGEPCAGESLQALITSIADYKSKYYWLDFKNSEDSLTVVSAIPLLKEQLGSLSILDNCIVESKNPDCIDSLVSNGLFSSYWVPHHYDFTPWYSDAQLKPLISDFLLHHYPTALSADYTMAPFLAGNFPNENIHIWTNGLVSEKDKALIQEIKEYPNIKVILIDYDLPF